MAHLLASLPDGLVGAFSLPSAFPGGFAFSLTYFCAMGKKKGFWIRLNGFPDCVKAR